MHSIPIALSNIERFGLMELAKQRNALKELMGIKSQRIDSGMSDIDTHYIGLKAEYAVAKLLGLEIDMTNTCTGDGGVDLIYRGLSIDVKYSQNSLKFRSSRDLVADVAILTNPLTRSMKHNRYYAEAKRDEYITTKDKLKWSNVLIVGWISREEFHEVCFSQKGLGGIDNSVVEANNMKGMNTLHDYAISFSTKKNLESVWTDSHRGIGS